MVRSVLLAHPSQKPAKDGHPLCGCASEGWASRPWYGPRSEGRNPWCDQYCHPPFPKTREGWGTLCVVVLAKAGPVGLGMARGVKGGTHGAFSSDTHPSRKTRSCEKTIFEIAHEESARVAEGVANPGSVVWLARGASRFLARRSVVKRLRLAVGAVGSIVAGCR